jgi:hypothetical protein
VVAPQYVSSYAAWSVEAAGSLVWPPVFKTGVG